MSLIVTPPWLEIAEAEMALGVWEVAGNQHDPRILVYHSFTSLRATTDEVPWCSSAMCFCMEEAGPRSTRSARARSWLRWGIALEQPAHGCIVVMKRGGGNQPGPEVIEAQGHVGLLVGTPTPRDILVAGGNQSNGFNVKPYPVERVLGYRWAG